MTKPVKTAATAPVVGGAELDAAAVKIVEAIGLPSFQQAMVEQPELGALEPLRVVDLISASLAESMFADTAPDQEVLVDLGGDVVAVPPGQRELLQSAITRVLAARTEELARQLKVKS